MRKIISISFLLSIILFSCKAATTVESVPTTEQHATVKETIDETISSNITTLPKYEYKGKVKYMDIVCKELDNYSKEMYSNDNLMIPSPIILLIDDSNESDIKIFGHFNLYFYSLKDNDTLLVEAGGHTIGCMHFAKLGNNYQLQKYDTILDENDFENRLRNLTEGYPDLYDKFIQNEYFEQAQNYFISDYVNYNKFYNIKYYQSYGSDKKLLMNLKNEASSKNEFIGIYAMENDSNKMVIDNNNIILTLEDIVENKFDNYKFEDNKIYVDFLENDNFLYAEIIKHNNNVVFVITSSNIENMPIGKTLTFYKVEE